MCSGLEVQGLRLPGPGPSIADVSAGRRKANAKDATSSMSPRSRNCAVHMRMVPSWRDIQR
eukprot:2814641-Rhodomonas_salina.2